LGPTDPLLEGIGAGRSQAYLMRSRLLDLVSSQFRGPGRPESPPTEERSLMPVLEACCDYTARHPGAVSVGKARSRYSSGYRRFVVELAGPGGLAEGLSLADLSRATRVPKGTLQNWLCPPPGRGRDVPSPEGSDGPGESPPSEGLSGDPEPERDPKVSDTVRDAHLRQIFALWEEWQGALGDFCRMVRDEYRLDYSRTFIGDALQAAGLRNRERRKTGPAPWSQGTYRSYFPGAQWLGDGTSIAVRFLNRVFVFNVEVLLDVASNALVGLKISDAEDEEALRQAYEAGITTAGTPPIAATLDNRPSNHSPGAAEALGDTMVLRSAPGRPESKAPIEGAFGLFRQAVPPLVFEGESQRELARDFLEAVLVAWARGRNGRPRRRLGGLSPVEAYRTTAPTQEEVDRAVQELRERQRRQEEALRTSNARRDPARLSLLSQGLADLGIPDPKGTLATRLARYSRESITYGVAAFRTKRDLGTLPPGADAGLYLGGIIRNNHEKRELRQFSDHLLEQRLRLRDFSLEPLNRRAESLRARFSPFELPQVYVDQALEAEFDIDFRFWAGAAARALAALPAEDRSPMYRHLCRFVAATFRVPKERRTDLVDRLASAATLAA